MVQQKNEKKTQLVYTPVLLPNKLVFPAAAVEGCPNNPVPICVFEPNKPPTGAVEEAPNAPNPK